MKKPVMLAVALVLTVLALAIGTMVFGKTKVHCDVCGRVISVDRGKDESWVFVCEKCDPSINTDPPEM